jgi:hypothetical protein
VELILRGDFLERREKEATTAIIAGGEKENVF